MKKALDRKAIGNRFKEWLIDEFGSVNEGARKIGKDPDGLRSNYLSGQSLPGAPLLAEMMQYGCDIYWLFWGDKIKKDDVKKTSIKNRIDKFQKKRASLKIELDQAIGNLENLKKSIDKMDD